ncbi:MAG: M4 family metallopeptidase [Acidobacteria bacterium]|nr:M4 family metallopeptidase [Acidobacteriota bacterium]
MKTARTTTRLFTTVIALLITTIIALAAGWRALQVGAQNRESSSDPQVLALRRLQSASRTPVRTSFAQGFPRSVAARVAAPGNNAVERAGGFLRQYQDLYGQSGPHLALKVRRVNHPPVEGVLFYQTYRGIEVFGAELLVSLSRGEVFHTVGGLLTSQINLDTAPNLFEDDALNLVRRRLERPDASIAAPTRLMVFDRSLFDPTVSSQPRLAWRVTLEQGKNKNVFVDAHSGEILLSLPSAYDGGSPLHGLDLDMKDAEDESMAQDSNCYWWSDDVDVANENYFNTSYNNDPDAVQGFDFIKGIYGFFHENFNRHSYDNDFSQVELFIHSTVSKNISIAQWVKACELIQVGSGHIGYDVLGHEFMHGVINDTSGLVYAFQPGALNESYADIMGAVADMEREEALGQGTDWLVGEGRTGGGGAIRNLSNPEQFGHPVSMSDPNFMTFPPNTAANDGNDYGGVHTNSGVPNRTSYLMTVGGVFGDLTVPWMPRYSMRNVKWTAATTLPNNANFLDARNQEVAIAEDWAENFTYGFVPQYVCSIRNAWALVGVGNRDSDCDGIEDPSDPDPDGDTIPSNKDNCDTVANPGQQNHDTDSLGDLCDSDDDNDGVPDAQDNCPFLSNPDQAPCDDLDNDQVLDTEDNCNEYNPNQKDSNGDGEGDACEADTDGDGINADEGDNCPALYNPDQANADGDGYGDACDKCPNTKESNPKFKFNGQPFQPDSDGDGAPDACDTNFFFDNAPAQPGVVKVDDQTHDVRIEITANYLLRVPFVICPPDCPEWYDQNDYVELLLIGLDKNAQVRVTDDEGRSVKKATGPAERRQIRFKPVGGRDYFLSFAFRPGMAQRQVAFQMRLSASSNSRGSLPKFQ